MFKSGRRDNSWYPTTPGTPQPLVPNNPRYPTTPGTLQPSATYSPSLIIYPSLSSHLFLPSPFLTLSLSHLQAPLLRPTFAILSLRKPWFNPCSVYMSSVAKNSRCCRFFCQYSFFPVTFIPPALHTHIHLYQCS